MTGTTAVLNEFKMTELGPLPNEWQVAKLGDVAEVHDKRRIPLSAEQRKTMKGLYPYCGANGVIDQINDYIFDGEYVLLAEDGGFWGKFQETAYLMEGKFWVNNHAHIIGANSGKAVNKFLLYYLNFEDIDVYTSGTTRKKLNQNVMKRIPISLPPLPEQRRIAAVLSTVQEAKEKTEAVIQATRELKKSLMNHLFTYGPVPLQEAENVSLKETEIGLVPQGWEVVKLGAVCQKTRQADPTRNPEVKFSYIDVSSISRDFLSIVDSTEYVGANAPSRARKVIRRNDVIFATVRPYLKRIAVVPAEFDGQICSTAFCVIKANPAVAYSDYFFYAVSRDAFVERVSEHQRGSSYPAVTDKDVLRELIPLPPMPIQQRIASTLIGADKKIETEENKKEALEELFKTLLCNLMTGKIRVSQLEVGA